MHPGIVCFVKRGCPACQEFKPRLLRAAARLPIEIVDVDARQDLMERFKVQYTPTVLIVSRRGIHGRIESALTNAELARFLEPVRRFYKVPATSVR